MSWQRIVVFILILAMQSCSPEDEIPLIEYTPVESILTEFDEELFTLVNEYRISKGFIKVHSDTLVGGFAKDHCIYMIKNDKPSHDNFGARHFGLVNYGAKMVGEVVAYGYSGSKSTLNAYLNSEGHKRVIEGEDYTHVGIKSIKNDKGRYYNVMIFVRF